VDEQTLVGLPDNPAVLHTRVKLLVAGVPVELVRPVEFRYADRALGGRQRALGVVPAVAVNLRDQHAIFPSAAPRKVQVSVKANGANAEGDLRLDLPAGWKAEPPSQHFKVAIAGEQEDMSFLVTPPSAEAMASLRAVATVGGREISSGMRTILYPHIPIQTL